MKRIVIASALMISSFCVVTQAMEPGQLRRDDGRSSAGQPSAPAVRAAPASTNEGPLDMRRLFARARGLNEAQAQSLHFNRVSCARRIYSQAGWSIEGDATISSVDPNRPIQTAYVMDEFKVLEDSYPPTFLVKESISAPTIKFEVFYVCQ